MDGRPTRICVYAIAKDEQENAAKWYERVKCADFVVVLDTGSSDRTVEILRGLGASVFTKKYGTEEHDENGEKDSVSRAPRISRFRFDTARNDALQYALETGADVFFALDMDEFPDPGWDEALRNGWNPEVHTRATYDLYLNDSSKPGSLNWIHDRSWRWRYPVHEVMERRDGSGVSYHVSHQLDLRGGKLVVRHPDHPETHDTYLPLLRLRLEEWPDDQDTIAYYLRELMYYGKADEILDFEPKIRMHALRGNPGAWVCLCLADAHDRKKHVATADALLFRAWTLDPENRTAPTRLAARLCAEGDPLGAEAVLKRAFAISGVKGTEEHEEHEKASSPSSPYFPVGRKRPDCLFLDHEDVWLWRMADWLGVALYQQGKYREALEHFRRALAGANTEDARKHCADNIRFCEQEISKTTEHTEHTEQGE